MEKKCNKCNVVKDVGEFNKTKRNKDGLDSICRECGREKAKRYREANKEKIKQYYQSNKQQIIDRVKKYDKANKEQKKIYKKQYDQDNKEYIKEYYLANKEKKMKYGLEYVKSRYKTDSLFKLTTNIRHAVRRYFKNGKSKTTREIIGIDYKEFQDYLKVEYTEGMHLDHIIPLSWAINDEEVYTLNHYLNFQIITAEENLAKSDTYCKSENLKKVLDNHNDLAKLNKIIERNSDKIT